MHGYDPFDDPPSKDRDPFAELPKALQDSLKVLVWLIAMLAFGVLAYIAFAIRPAAAQPSPAEQVERMQRELEQACAQGCVVVPRQDWEAVHRLLARCAGPST